MCLKVPSGYLVLLVGDLDDDESESADDADADEDEDAAHVLQPEGGRRVVVPVPAVHLAVQEDPLVVQVLHGAALVEVQDGQRHLVRPGGVLLQADSVAGAAEEVAGRDEVALAGGLELQAGAVPDERVEVPAAAVACT